MCIYTHVHIHHTHIHINICMHTKYSVFPVYGTLIFQSLKISVLKFYFNVYLHGKVQMVEGNDEIYLSGHRVVDK